MSVHVSESETLAFKTFQGQLNNLYHKNQTTLPETNIAPENGWLED